MYVSKRKEALRTASRLSLKAFKITLYIGVSLVITSLRSALRAFKWAQGKLDPPVPTFNPQLDEEDMYYECKSEPITKPELNNPRSECGEEQQDRGGPSSSNPVPNCFEGTSDLSGTLPFALSDLTKEVRSVNSGRDGIAA